MTGLASNLGVALVAAQADGFDWNIPGAPSADVRAGDEELAYFDALIEDLTKRFAIDRTRLVASGFSAGAMVVWNLACYRGASFAGFAPVAGTFWDPLPEVCPSGSVNLIHYHGTEDPVVPLQGRKVKNSHQGDVFKAIELIARSGGYYPAESESAPGLQCNRQVDRDGRLLELCLFAGQHELKVAHLARAWRVFVLRSDGNSITTID
jgi:polyhydroxybutyrate depolymerase